MSEKMSYDPDRPVEEQLAFAANGYVTPNKFSDETERKQLLFEQCLAELRSAKQASAPPEVIQDITDGYNKVIEGLE
jgi:hypothetical protein